VAVFLREKLDQNFTGGDITMRVFATILFAAILLLGTVNFASASGTEKKTPYKANKDGSATERSVERHSDKKKSKAGSTSERSDEAASDEEQKESKKNGSTTEKKKKSYGSGTELN